MYLIGRSNSKCYSPDIPREEKVKFQKDTHTETTRSLQITEGETHLDLIRLPHDLGHAHRLFGGILQIGGEDHFERRVLDDFAREVGVGPRQANDYRLPHHDLLRGFAHTVGDDIALHDATENIDKNRLDGVVGVQQLERLLDLLLVRASADVQKVGRLPPP